MSGTETRRVHSPDWAGKEVLLLRTCSDGALARILDTLRTHFSGARVTLLTSSLQSSPPGSFEACHVHRGGRRALLAWVRARRWEVVAIPWTGEPVLPRWKAILPWLARTRHRVVFNEYGGFFRLGWSGLGIWVRHLRWRWRRPAVHPLSGVRLRLLIELVVGSLAVLRMAVRVPVLLGLVGVRVVSAALLRHRGGRPAAP